MCLAQAVFEPEREGEEEELFCENVARVEVDGQRITVYDLIGRPYETEGTVKSISFVGESKLVIAKPSR